MRSFLVVCLVFSCMDAKANLREVEAARRAAEAAIKQSGLDRKIEENVVQPIKRKIEPYLGEYAPILGAIKIAVEGRVELRWEF